MFPYTYEGSSAEVSSFVLQKKRCSGPHDVRSLENWTRYKGSEEIGDHEPHTLQPVSKLHVYSNYQYTGYR
jgi:hypothetical protein